MFTEEKRTTTDYFDFSPVLAMAMPLMDFILSPKVLAYSLQEAWLWITSRLTKFFVYDSHPLM